MASLLEVGTGFHPELTGRENIYPQRRHPGHDQAEIDRKFDEIVAFAEIEKFLDTPVKRYLLGHVRAAGVCRGRASGAGNPDRRRGAGGGRRRSSRRSAWARWRTWRPRERTVLFVSHDLSAVEKLCTRGILLDGGKVQFDGTTSQTIAHYQRILFEAASTDLTTRIDRRGAGTVKFTSMQFLDERGRQQNIFFSGRPLRVRMHYRSEDGQPLLNARISLTFNSWGKTYFLASTELHRDTPLLLPPEGYIDCVVDELPLSLGTYYLGPFVEVNGVIEDWMESAATLQVEDGNFYGTGKDYPLGWDGKTVLVKHRWETATESLSSPALWKSWPASAVDGHDLDESPGDTVVLIIFNRPQLTAQVYERVRAFRPERLFVVADGPRADRQGERELCDATRAVVSSPDWPCELVTNYSSENMGCDQRVSSGLDWVFQHCDRAMVLEDDCVPSPEFFTFCAEMLEHYKDDLRIMHVSGDNFQDGQWRGDGSYYFSHYTHSWGWGTWSRAWRYYDGHLSLWPEAYVDRWLHTTLDDQREAWYWEGVFRSSTARRSIPGTMTGCLPAGSAGGWPFSLTGIWSAMSGLVPTPPTSTSPTAPWDCRPRNWDRSFIPARWFAIKRRTAIPSPITLAILGCHSDKPGCGECGAGLR